MKKLKMWTSVILLFTVGIIFADPNLIVLEYGADYYYEADDYFIGPWQYQGGDTVQILYESEDSSVSHVNYFMGPYYGPGDLYDGNEGNFIPVDDEDDGFYTGPVIDSVTVDLFNQSLSNLYLVATIYELPVGGYLEVEGTPASWDSSFHEADGWDHEGAWSAIFTIGDMPPNSQWNGQVQLMGYQRVEFWAFSDQNGNGDFDNSEIFSPSSHNLTFLGIPTRIEEKGTRDDPSSGLLILRSSSTIQLANFRGSKSVKLFDSVGRLVLLLRASEDEVTLSSLECGYYFLVLDNGIKESTRRLLILP